MKKGGWLIYLCSLLLLQQQVIAQACVDDYFSINLETSTVQDPIGAILTSNNELVLSGTVMRARSITLDGWITKFSAQGTILWSKHYTSGDFNYIRFNSIVETAKGDYLITGNIGNVDTTKWPPPPYSTLGFLAKMDKYGNLLWSKVFARQYVSNLSTDIKNIMRTSDNDFIVAVTYSARVNSCIIILRIDEEGAVKWSTTLTSPAAEARYSSLQVTQLRNQNIVAACNINISDVNNPFVVAKTGYYSIGIDYDSGLPQWQRLYAYTATPSNREKAFSDIIRITELPNNDISFIASYADTAYFYFRKTTKVINMITDNTGRLKTITAYTNSTPPIFASSVAAVGTTGDQVILMDNSDAPYLLCIDAAGQPKWQKSYPLVGRSQETRAITGTPYGYYFFSFTHNGGSADLKLVKTDINGEAECVSAELAITANDVTPVFKQENISLTEDMVAGYFYATPYIFTVDYKMNGTAVCRKACCTEIIDTVSKIDLCNVESFTLPNNDIIRQPGTYGVPYKSAKGCDSIVYYPISFSKKPEVYLGLDDCFAGKDSILLKTAEGYPVYNWMGTETGSNMYTAKNIGKYWVSVENACGIKTDTIELFKECEFPVYMPNAFSPNNDTHNDYFKVPALNRNRLVRLVVYNRWGQVVFQTADAEKSWDGTFNNQPQPVGVYIYFLQMQTLLGKPISQRGTIVLTR